MSFHVIPDVTHVQECTRKTALLAGLQSLFLQVQYPYKCSQTVYVIVQQATSTMELLKLVFYAMHPANLAQVHLPLIV